MVNLNNCRIAIVADWLIDFGWAELVISHLLEAFPEADIYTSVCFMKHPMLEWRKVYTSWLQKVPFFNKYHKLAGILRPWAFRSFDLSWYDVVITSSSAESKQVSMGKWLKKTKAPVIVYCHTPIRYYWSHFEEYKNMMEFGWLNPIAKWVLNLFIWWLRKVDLEAVKKVDYFIANSKNTAERIQKYYERESVVIYPGVNTIIDPRYVRKIRSFGELWDAHDEVNEEIQDGSNVSWISENESLWASKVSQWQENFPNISSYFISIGRCIPYKKFDLLVDAFNENGKNLVLITNTNNPLYKELKEKSKPNITWKLLISQDEKNNLLAWAKGFVFPPEEDFWLVPIESMTYGIPVIAYGKWWALETVVEWVTGIFFPEQTTVALNATIEKFETMEFDKNAIMNHAKEFDKTVFQRKIIDFISSTLQ